MKSLLLSFALLIPIFAQENTAQEALVAALFEARDSQAFEEAVTAGTKAGLAKQLLVEARFLYLVDTADRKTLAAYAPTLEKQLESFDIDDSVIFATPEDFQAVVKYTLALGALEKNDSALFKKYITEAFWLSPSQASIFEPHITRHRLDAKMAELTLDLNRKFESQEKKDSKPSLKELLGNSPALVLHFWTPWAQQSMQSMPDYFATAEVLAKNKIPAISVLISGNSKSRIDADSYLKETKTKLPGQWIVDASKKGISGPLRIQNFPTVVLISKDGKVLYNGNPSDPDFWKALKSVAPKLTRPSTKPPQEDLEKETNPTTEKGNE